MSRDDSEEAAMRSTFAVLPVLLLTAASAAAQDAEVIQIIAKWVDARR
jgi:hypothetical protein